RAPTAPTGRPGRRRRAPWRKVCQAVLRRPDRAACAGEQGPGVVAPWVRPGAGWRVAGSREMAARRVEERRATFLGARPAWLPGNSDEFWKWGCADARR